MRAFLKRCFSCFVKLFCQLLHKYVCGEDKNKPDSRETENLNQGDDQRQRRNDHGN